MKRLKELADKIAAEHGLEWYQTLNKAEDSAGMTAIDLGNGYSLHHEHSDNGHDIWAVGCNGERAGTFMLKTEDTRRNKPMVVWAGLEKAHRGKGVGTLAYKALAAHYGGIDSDKASSSDDAVKAWLRAGGRQMKLKTQFGKPRYTLDGDKKNPPIVWNEDLGKAEQELLEKSKIYDLYSPESEYEIKQEKSRFDASLGRNGTELNVFGLYHKPTGKRIGQHIYYSKLNRAKSLKLGEAVYSHYTQSIDIEPEHRRKGLANAMYMHAEQSGPYDRMAPTRNRTEEGKALWSQPNRPFGKSVTDDSNYLYHVTTVPNARKIMWEGLLPQGGGRIRGVGGEEIEHHVGGHVFLTSGSGVPFWHNRLVDWTYHRHDDPAATLHVPVVLRIHKNKLKGLNVKNDELGTRDAQHPAYKVEGVLGGQDFEQWDGNKWSKLDDIDMTAHEVASLGHDNEGYLLNHEESKLVPPEDMRKNNPSHSLHLINKFEGSSFAPTEFHYSVKSNGKEIGRAIVFDKDPRSIHQAGKTGPSLKDIRLHPDYQGQGHSQGIINKLVDMHGPLASDSRGNISPAGAKMFHKYGIKQPDESYMLHGQSLKKSIENLIKNAREDWKNENLIKNNKNNTLVVYHGSDTLPFGKKPTPYETTGIFVTPSIDLAKEFGKDIHTFSYPKEKILDLNNENHLQILKTKYTQSEIDYIKGDEGLPHALNRSSDSPKKLDKLREMALNSGFHASFQQETEWPNKPTSIEIYKTKHLIPQNKNNSIKKSSDINFLIQQAKARLEGVKKVGSQEPRPMIFANKDGKRHAFVTVDPSKKGQWRVTHFINSRPAGHTEAPTFSHAIKVAHESGYNVFKEIPEEELFKAESLIKAAHPSDLKRITNKTNPQAQEIVDAASHAVHAPDQAYVDFLNHPKVQKGLGKGDIGGISAKMVHKVGNDTYMAKPYHKKIESATREMNPHPISGWSTMATRNLFHAAGIGHLCEDVSFHEHNGVPMTVHKFAKQAYNANAYGWRPDLVKNHIDTQGKQIAIMDFLTNNRDRHVGNVLFKEYEYYNNLLAIDHERNFQYNQNYTETPNSYIKSIGLQYTQQNPNNPSFAGDQATKDWWKSNRNNIVNSFNKDIESIKDPHLKNHIHTNFMKRVGWLDEYSDPDHLDFFDDAAVPVEMFKERRPKTDYKAIMKNLPENPYKAIGVIDSLFSKKLSPATKETLADLWNEQVDKMSGEEVGNYFKDIRKTKNHRHPKGAYWSLMNRLVEKNHRQGMQHLVQNNMIDLPYWKDKFEEALKQP